MPRVTVGDIDIHYERRGEGEPLLFISGTAGDLRNAPNVFDGPYPKAFDLVVTDFNMPGLSGLDVARQLRAIRPDLPVAVTSGFISEELRAGAPDAGVCEIIFKPDTVEELCDVIQRLLLQQPGPA